MKKALVNLVTRLIVFTAKVAMSFIAAWIVSGPMIELAAKERGYTGAYGSEWIVIFGTFALAYYLATKGCNTFINKKSEI